MLQKQKKPQLRDLDPKDVEGEPTKQHHYHYYTDEAHHHDDGICGENRVCCFLIFCIVCTLIIFSFPISITLVEATNNGALASPSPSI